MKKMDQNICGFQAALCTAEKYCRDWQDEDYVVHLEHGEPAADQSGYIKLWAEDLEFCHDEILQVFTAASSVQIQTIEVEVENSYVFVPEVTFWFQH